MIKRVLRHGMREPIPCIAAILFTAILTVILCYLHRSQKEEQQNLEKTYYATPVEFAITWLDGTRLNDSAPASGHMADMLPELFRGTSRHEPQFDDLVTDLQIRMSIWCEPFEQKEPADDGIIYDAILIDKMVGITSPDAAYDQPSEFGDLIQWYDGYDESILLTDEFVCIVPSDYGGPMDEVKVTLSKAYKYTCTFKIVGQYTEKYNYNLYCPYLTMEYIYIRLSWPKEVQRLTGRLANNDDLELFRERAKEWFATPNPAGEPTPWDKMSYEYYPLAIDIQDAQLKALMKDMENSVTVDRIASFLVFLLSAGAGFLTGFLVIRSRKQEIGLMRTLGTSNGMICVELGVEQMLCVSAGVIIGGSYSLWEPIGQLSIFAGVYIAGLTVALLIFTRANLLATMKEDE